MNHRLEELLLRFERETRSNPEFRIEDLGESLDQLLKAPDLSEKDRQRFFAELLRLETGARYEQGEKLTKAEYEARFPDDLPQIDEAFRILSERQREDDSGFELLGVTQAFDGDIDVNPQASLGLPSELCHYRNIQKVGEGSFGIVCKAWDIDAEEYRALKFPTSSFDRDADYLAAVRAETDKSVGLDHPHIVRTYGMEVCLPYAFVVQEFVDGIDLKTWMTEDHTLAEKVQMVIGICRGLQYAHSHEKEITHCDIKPANIMVDSHGQPKITDFGLSFHEKDRFGLPARMIGSPAYLAPEIVEGYVRQSDGRADIFSLGVVLYEMLTDRRPFHAPNEEVYLEILKKDPKPIRLRNPDVDEELERICFRCLQKKTLDRYPMAADLEQDLTRWLDPPPQDDELVVPLVDGDFVPRGLRSYTAADAGFFLELLPGVRGRGNIPLSLDFWIERIREPVADELRMPQGFLFGPSGSGKSSFVKAGLMPLISDRVETIYVEATTEDTEVRIIKAVKNRFPAVPENLSVPELMAGLAHGKWRERGRPRKILLVLDQFEQWLTREELYDASQLVRGLKHCDGEHLQCLLLVRDDFFLACVRFADALGLHLKENENLKDIDLFSEEHARHVLIKLGQAYGKLPASGDLDREQDQFLDRTISQLARNRYVVCVRLTLFAEMFKDREWTVGELDKVGGVAGVGEQFLESRFGEESLTARYRGQRKRVQAILEELLPESGRDIRGAMKTRDKLLAAARCENQPVVFDDVIETLHDELKLITRTDPDAAGDASIDEELTGSNEVHYQLTHDYLVPAIRDWLNTELKNSRRGRALIRLRELAHQVVPGQKPKYLPSNFEWLSWQFSIRHQARTEQEKLVLRHGRRKFARTLSLMALLLVLIGLPAWVFLRSTIRAQAASDIVERVKENDLESIWNLRDQIASYADTVIPVLTHLEESSGLPPTIRERVGFALASQEPGREQLLLELLANRDTKPEEVFAIVSLLKHQLGSAKAMTLLEAIRNDSGSPVSHRLRGGMGMAILDPQSRALDRSAKFLLDSIAKEPVLLHDEWLNVAESFGSRLVEPAIEMLRLSKDRTSASAFANAIFRFARPSAAIESVSEIILGANGNQFIGMLDAVRKFGFADDLKSLLLQIKEERRLEPAAYARLCVTLFQLGERSTLIEVLEDESREFVRNFIICDAAETKVPVDEVVNLFDSVEGDKSRSGVRVRRAVLMMFAELSGALFDQDQLKSLESIGRKVYELDGDPICFASAQLLLTRLGPRMGKEINLHKLREKRRGRHGDVYINSELMAFVVFPLDEDWDLAVSLTEMTEVEWNRTLGKSEPGSDDPVILTDLHELYEVCNRLSDDDGIPENQWVMPRNHRSNNHSETVIDTALQGYRIMSQGEIEQVLASLNRETYQTISTVSRFAQTIESNQGVVGPVATKLPCGNGLFDFIGNAYETSFGIEEGRLFLFTHGFTCRDSHREIFSYRTQGWPTNTPLNGQIYMGVRLVRLLSRQR